MLIDADFQDYLLKAGGFLTIVLTGGKIYPQITQEDNMYKLFARYASVGVINTTVHWAVFFTVHAAGVNQTFSNMCAFFVAVTFSFFANAKFTFKGEVTTGRYIIYLGFMGALAASVGQMSDSLEFPSIITLITFSVLSLIMGFFYSKYIVFREEK